MPEVPPFRSLRLIPRLNIVAVALSLSACTAAALGKLLPEIASEATSVPTLLAGLLWASLLRSPRTLGDTNVRVGWVASIPLALVNAGVACASAAVVGSSAGGNVAERVVGGFLIGALAGSIIWVPALLCTLACFGIPIAWAQSLEKKGLSGAERGEAVVAGVCVTLSALALALLMRDAQSHDRLFAICVAVGGAVLGLAAAALAVRRERERARFVERVARGEVAGYRVDQTHEGKALVRVSEQGAVAYRVADYREAICLLDEDGRATETRHTR